MPNKKPRPNVNPGVAVKYRVGRYVVKRHGKDREFPGYSGGSLFLFDYCGLFPVFDMVIYRVRAGILHPEPKKNAIFAKN